MPVQKHSQGSNVLIVPFFLSLSLARSDAEMQAQFTLNQSRAEEITMREDYGCQLPPLPHDEEGFGDLGFGDSGPLELIRDGSTNDHTLDPVRSRSSLPFRLEGSSSLGQTTPTRGRQKSDLS